MHHAYSMNGGLIQTVTEETDLDVIISKDLKPSKQCVSAVSDPSILILMGPRCS